MNEEKREPRKRGKGGRPPKNDPAKHRLTVNLTDTQHAGFLAMFEQSGVQSLSAFISARIFGDGFRVVKTDASGCRVYRKADRTTQPVSECGRELQPDCKGTAQQFRGEKSSRIAL